MEKELLRKLQMEELAILEEIDCFCREYGIHYSLYGGTALGAVRHGGFIPWDDDLDIVMTRHHYNKFCKEWMLHHPKGYFLQNAETDIRCGINHTKIRKENTLFISENDPTGLKSTHQGIWIDILIWDKVPDNGAKAGYLYWNLVRSLLYTRGYTRNNNESFSKKFAKGLLLMIPERVCKRRMHHINHSLQRYSKMKEGYSWMSLSCFSIIKKQEKYPADIAYKYTTIPFEGRRMMIFKDYQRMLEINFGDFWKLPPVEERVCGHNPVKIVFGDSEKDEANGARFACN